MLEDDYFSGTKHYYCLFAEVCKPIIDYLGVNSAYYVNVDKHGRAFAIYLLRGWGERVVEKEHYKLECGLVHPSRIHSGFAFSNAIDDSLYKNNLLHDGAVNFNWWHAFCFVDKQPRDEGYVGLHFAVPKDNYEVVNTVVNEYVLVKKMANQINNRLRSLIKDMDAYRVDTADLKGDAFYTQKGLIFKEEKQNHRKVTLLKEMGLIDDESLLRKPALSPQEANCLKAYMATPNMKQVARALNLAVSTVSSYIENIKDKLDCYTKQALLEKAAVLDCLSVL